MKITLTLLFAIGINILFAQSKSFNIEYELFYNTEYPNTQYANLYVDQARSVSMYMKQKSGKIDQKILDNKNEMTRSASIGSKN
jgi:hypothetical protein